jgi:hypothetical protein
MLTDPDATLQELFRREVQAVCEAARRKGGKVSPDDLHELERLARLVELKQSAKPRKARKRWPLAAALGGTLVLASVLLFARVSQTDIQLDIALSGVAFQLAAPHVLAASMDLSSIGVSGLDAVDLPESIADLQASPRVPDGVDDAIRLSVLADDERRGTVTLAPLALSAGTSVRLEATGVPSQFRLTLSATDLRLGIAVEGPVLLALAGSAATEVNVATPRSIRMQSRAGEVDLAVAIAAATPVTLASQVAVRDLSMMQIAEFASLDRTVARHESTILSGSLYFDSLQGEERILRPREVLRFDSSIGDLGILALDSDRIGLKFYGTVRGLRTGTGEAERSLMPTYLDWLQARHGLSLLWGSALYLFGLVVAAMKWWRGER